MKAINQSSGLECFARFYSASGLQVTPSTVDWKLTDDETGTVAQDWTAATITVGDDPGSTIEIAGTLNTVPNNRNFSVKRLTVAADRGTAREYSKTTTYRVNRLR